MLLVVIGITYGTLIGLFGNWLLFRKMDTNKRQGIEPMKGIGAVFFLRYLFDAIALVLFALVVTNGIAITAAAVSVTIAVKVSLFIAYARKGGRFG